MPSPSVRRSPFCARRVENRFVSRTADILSKIASGGTGPAPPSPVKRSSRTVSGAFSPILNLRVGVSLRKLRPLGYAGPRKSLFMPFVYIFFHSLRPRHDANSSSSSVRRKSRKRRRASIVLPRRLPKSNSGSSKTLFRVRPRFPALPTAPSPLPPPL